MQKGDIIRTPRFLTVTIEAVLTKAEAADQGYNEPTHYWDDPNFDIYGKVIGTNRMNFAAVKKN